MADLLYLSFWLRGFNGRSMLRTLERALLLFPFSASSPGVTTLRIYALQYAEPPLLETFYDRPTPPDAAIQAASEFEGPDCCYLAGGYWDLWQRDSGWRLMPAPVTVGCYGPEFENELGDQLRIELGLDSHYLPRPGVPESSAKVKSNIRSILRLAQELDQALPVDKRRLWTESGEDFAERLRSLAL
ncbi:MAG: hypothetical protein ACE141_05845 [Bryobacteraceae bacterium]